MLFLIMRNTYKCRTDPIVGEGKDSDVTFVSVTDGFASEEIC